MLFWSTWLSAPPAPPPPDFLSVLQKGSAHNYDLPQMLLGMKAFGTFGCVQNEVVCQDGSPPAGKVVARVKISTSSPIWWSYMTFLPALMPCVILQGNLVIDVQGMAIGNGWFDPISQVSATGTR